VSRKNQTGRNRGETYQLNQWSGQFGNDYVDRNTFEKWKMDPGKKAFQSMIGSRTVDSILEIGSNRGLNLIYLTGLMNHDVELYAVEPNKKAFKVLESEKRIKLRKAWNCSAFDVPLGDSSIDLVFTCGVLIHIAPEDLGRATDEIVRVAKKYVLCVEYFSNDPIAKKYRGHENLLFKRDFGSFYLERYPKLRCMDYGFLWEREYKIFDNLNWWLFEKRKF